MSARLSYALAGNDEILDRFNKDHLATPQHAAVQSNHGSSFWLARRVLTERARNRAYLVFGDRASVDHAVEQG